MNLRNSYFLRVLFRRIRWLGTLFVFSLFVPVACQKGSAGVTGGKTIDFTKASPEIMQEALQGNWRLKSTCGGITGGCGIVTEHSFGYNLRFSGDSVIYSNADGINAAGRIVWTKENYGDSAYAFSVDGSLETVPFGIDNGILSLGSDFIDGVGHTYQEQ